ncbi:MAG: hypothetical protein KJ674_00960 [Nanoarchaeota archaeon]|nr:hypothetical protein [Nanoarchaeota archaeon]
MIISNGLEKFNRNILETKKNIILIGIEKNKPKDFMKSRNSGLNQVLCKLAKKNNISIGISFNDILNSKDRINLLGRIMFNIKLCRKYKVKVILCNSTKNKEEIRNEKDLRAFALTLGLSPSEINIKRFLY